MSQEMIRLAGRRVTVLGAGQTGLAAARFLSTQGAQVYLSERAALAAEAARQLEAWGVEYEQGGHSERALVQAELIVPSPGIPMNMPILRAARCRGIPIMGELELGYLACPSRRIIAVTGSVGKTTTVSLIEYLLRANGHQVVRAGNEAQPFVAALPQIGPETIVLLEVSSFQLETVESFSSQVGVFTCFAPNHLDRHGTLAAYFALKCRLFRRQTEGDWAIVQHQIELPSGLRARTLRFDGSEIDRLSQRGLLPHQRADLAAAWLACRVLAPQIKLERFDLSQALALPHRIQFVAQVAGVAFYDDSKATCSAATQAALQGFSSSLVLIVGGRSKGEDLSQLVQAIRERDLKGVLLMGEAAPQFARALCAAGYRRFHYVDNLSEAVRLALELKPQSCLLSPACASFDQFSNYRERGRVFQGIVRAVA